MSPPGFYWQFVIVWLWDAGTDRGVMVTTITLHSTPQWTGVTPGRGGGTQHCLHTIQPVTACDGGTAAPKLNLGCSEKIGFSIQLLYNWRNENPGLNISDWCPLLSTHECWLLRHSEPVCHVVHCGSAAGGLLSAHHNAEHHNETRLLMAIFIINHQPQLSLPCSWVISF